MSMTELDRARLQNAVAEARSVLEKHYQDVLEGRYGIHRSGRSEDPARLALTAAEQSARAELVAFIAHLKSDGLGPDRAAARLLREAVFTSLNRLVAIRVAEAIGLLPESLARGRDSRGYREFLEIFPLLAKDATAGYWPYLRLLADELARDAPVLFDPRNPLLALEPSPRALDDLVAIFADRNLATVWADPEAFGWTYQYFISTDERRAAREAQAPRNSQDLAVRNQWFTPRYVVDFLVHNTLGRRLLEANPESALRDALHMLVDPPQDRGRPLELEEVRILDPAVGSGHFLLGCYDVLEKAWEERGVPPREAAARILPCLWGIDIDSRCAQVAAAALVLRARRRARDADLPRPNVFTARTLPADPAAWQSALQHLDDDLRALVQRIQEVLKDAPILGSLLTVEEALQKEIQTHAERRTGGRPGELFEQAARDEFARAEAAILEALRRVAAEASSNAAERLLAAEATDAIGFVEAMRGRYDTVLMNPPFGEPVPETKTFLKAAYPWIPWKDYNLLAAFVGRGIELLGEGGYLGAITSRAGLFLTTFEEWRKEVLLRHRLVALADLGYGVMEGAMVEAAAYVVGADQRRRGDEAVFLRLLKDTARPAALAEACREAREGKVGGRVFRVAPEELEEIPGAPLAYWVAPSIRRLFSELPPLEGNGAEVRQGLATADDFRFVRAFWEVDPARIGRSREETFRGKRWVPFAKGGEYSPYYADIHLVVDWEEDGRRIREFEQAVVRNAQYYFRPGLTWTERTNSGFKVRPLPAGSVFSVKGPGILFTELPSALVAFSWMNTRLTQVIIDGLVSTAEETMSGSQSRDYGVGVLQKLPCPAPKLGRKAAVVLADRSAELIAMRASFDDGDETTRRFVCPAVLRHDGTTLDRRIRSSLDAHEDSISRGIGLAYEAERILHQALGLDAESERYLDEEYGPHPGSYPAEPLSAEEEREFDRLYRTPMDKLIDEVVETRGGARTIATKSYFLDRRLEVLAHVFCRHPSVLAEARRRLGLLPPEEPRRSAEDLVSYLVGCAFGRFDVRIGRDPSFAPPAPDPFDPVPVCSPGTLVGPDGLPAREAPEGYPLELPPDHLLLDEEGHPWDIVLRVRRAAEVLFDDPDAILEECERILGRDLRGYLRRDFFKAHLGRYSKSRRKAPIYWYLSVPSREWGLWLYAPTLSRETLFAVVREARRKEGALVQGIDRVRQQMAAASGRERQRLARQLDAQEDLLREVRAFLIEAERVANLGWEPDLDDGIVLCAAPLADLMPAWRKTGGGDGNGNPGDPVQARRMLKAGKFPWATVSRFKEAL